MPGVSIHVMDVSRGLVAAGMLVELRDAQHRAVARGETDSNGVLEAGAAFAPGIYAAEFHVAAWYRSHGVSLPEVPFLDVVHYHFGISDPQQHYHLPFKCTPWGYSCFRGGA